MIIFLYGVDDYRRLAKRRELLAEFEKKRSALGVKYFDAMDKEWLADFEEFSASQSLFETAKLGVFENAFEMDAAKLAKLLKPFVSEKGITLLLSERDKPVKALSFLLEKPVISQKFETLAGVEWSAFITNEAKKAGVTLAPTAMQFLATVYVGNSWALATELQKLTGLCDAGQAKTKHVVTKEDLNSFDLEAAPNYWILLSGLKSPDVRTRLATLERLFAMNDPAAKIFNILASQWKERTAAMAQFDIAIKSGKLDYEEALVDLLIS